MEENISSRCSEVAEKFPSISRISSVIVERICLIEREGKKPLTTTQSLSSRNLS